MSSVVTSSCDRPHPEARLAAGLTQADLAGRIRTTQSVVSRWERGGDEPRLSTLDRILRACGRRLAITVEDDDVDRSQIRQQLAMTPARTARVGHEPQPHARIARRVT